MISCLIIIIAGMVNAAMDTIVYSPSVFSFQTDWWLARGAHAWDKRSRAEKYMLSFLSDGWHCLKAAYLILLFASAAFYHPVTMPAADILIFYILHGAGFEFSYKFIVRVK